MDVSVCLQVWWQCLRRVAGGGIRAVVANREGTEKRFCFSVENAGVVEIVDGPSRIEIQCLEVELEDSGKRIKICGGRAPPVAPCEHSS